LNVVVLDIGRTHIKVCLVDGDGNIVERFETDNETRILADVEVFDTDQIWAWFLETLSRLCRRTRPDAISTTTHGAAAALLGRQGRVLDVMDYESTRYDEVTPGYRALRDPFESTGSPELANGLNLGHQIYWMQHKRPELFSDVISILPYPQYWSYLLSGRRTAEVTSLGAHTDLWLPRQRQYSALVSRCNWAPLFPPMHKAWRTIGPALPRVCELTGLASDCRILCGIHDSNAAYTYHYEAGRPMTLLSTGTWVIGLCSGGPSAVLQEQNDELLNVNLLQEPLSSFRFMGGQEWSGIAGDIRGTPGVTQIQDIVSSAVFALPAFSSQGGPFRHRAGSIEGNCPTDLHRKALASMYCAQVTAWCLERFASTGDIIVDGPFIRDEIYLSVLASLVSERQLLVSDTTDGTALGAARLAIWPDSYSPRYRSIAAAQIKGLDAYHDTWCQKVTG
jgi:L-fuculokinase